jgi:alcohol dehydrogenase (cytochrome c)
MNARLLFLLLSISLDVGSAQVSSNRILNSDKEPQNWLTYGGSYSSQRYSTLDQVNRDNVKDLELKWVFQAKSLDPFQTTPLVVDGVLYTVQGNDVVALDALTGRMFWIYRYTPADAGACCGRISRGLAILGDTLFLATLDAHLIAIDSKDGQPLWDTTVANPKSGYSMTLAPLVIKDKVIVGTAGGERGIRGFLAAYDTRTGKEAWRFNTIPGPGEAGHETWGGDSWMHGGGSVWVTGSYDPETNLTYWGVGNPGPDYDGDVRPGDNLYTCSVIALDADTGKLKWHYQFMPHDEFDWEAVQVPVLADMTWQGRPRKVMLWANRNGFYYVLDRTSGQFLLGKPFVRQNWNVGFDEKGRPIKAPMTKTSKEGVLIYPGNQGGTNWFNPSYSPHTGLFYVNAWENTSTIFAKRDAEYQEGLGYTAGANRSIVPRLTGMGMRAPQGPNFRMEEENYSAVRALDPHTGERKWEFKMSEATDAGILTTASDLLFSGGREGYFFALDARTGGLLWKAALGGQITMGPITYSVDRKQYVAAAAGNVLFVFALR